MSEFEIISPGYNRQPIEGLNSIQELPWCGKIIIRGNPDDSEFLELIKGVANITLPLLPNTQITNGSLICFWLGPNEWLLHSELSATQNLITNLKETLISKHSSVVDVTDYYSILRIEGPDAITLLLKACPLDLHPNVFHPGDCTQTRFGHASILLHKINDSHRFDIQVRWSYTEYVLDYLKAALKTIQN